MAKKITTGKREREKIKQNKRQEKQKRKEQRQGSGTSSFEEMLAYVDENGLLHTTPQDMKPKKEIDVSTIEVSVPKQSETDEPSFLSGCVVRFNDAKGYGFIKEDDSNEQYFFHISNAPAEIAEGDIVTFEIERGERGLNAVQIAITNKKQI